MVVKLITYHWLTNLIKKMCLQAIKLSLQANLFFPYIKFKY